MCRQKIHFLFFFFFLLLKLRIGLTLLDHLTFILYKDILLLYLFLCSGIQNVIMESTYAQALERSQIPVCQRMVVWPLARHLISPGLTVTQQIAPTSQGQLKVTAQCLELNAGFLPLPGYNFICCKLCKFNATCTKRNSKWVKVPLEYSPW